MLFHTELTLITSEQGSEKQDWLNKIVSDMIQSREKSMCKGTEVGISENDHRLM